jgi:hypothetical protein
MDKVRGGARRGSQGRLTFGDKDDSDGFRRGPFGYAHLCLRHKSRQGKLIARGI